MKTNHHRRGYSLIECIVFLTCVSLLMGLTGVLIQRLLRLDRADVQRAVTAQTVERLGRALRTDAHDALTSSRPSESKVQLRLIGGDEVAYEVVPSHVVRTLARQDKTTHIEIFTLPRDVGAKLALTSGGSAPVVVSVELDRPSDPANPADGLLRHYTIEATVGRHARFVDEVKK